MSSKNVIQFHVYQKSSKGSNSCYESYPVASNSVPPTNNLSSAVDCLDLIYLIIEFCKFLLT